MQVFPGVREMTLVLKPFVWSVAAIQSRCGICRVRSKWCISRWYGRHHPADMEIQSCYWYLPGLYYLQMGKPKRMRKRRRYSFWQYQRTWKLAEYYKIPSVHMGWKHHCWNRMVNWSGKRYTPQIWRHFPTMAFTHPAGKTPQPLQELWMPLKTNVSVVKTYAACAGYWR